MRVRDDMSAVHTEYGVVLLDETRGRYWKLSATAGIVLDALRGGGSEADAVAELTNRFAVDEQRAHRDVRALVTRFAELGVVQA